MRNLTSPKVATSVDPRSLVAAGLSDDEAQMVQRMLLRLNANVKRNTELTKYYQGDYLAELLGIAVPPEFKEFRAVAGWPSTVVDSLEERLDIDSFAAVGVTDVDSLGIDEWWAQNDGASTAGLAIVDSLIYGVSFIALSRGLDGEPDPLLTVEPATTMSGEWDARTRRLAGALHVEKNAMGAVTAMTVWTRRDVIQIRARGETAWDAERRSHGLDHVPVFRLANRPRGNRIWGSSEISKAVRSYTDSAARTLLGMEIAREFYSSPQRWIMGASEDAFVGADGKPRSAWQVYLGRILAIGHDDPDTPLPQVGQFNAASPAPYVDQVKLLAELCAAEGALPVTYFGFHTDNPPGGDGIRAQETRLVKRAERRQRDLGGMSGFAGLIRSMLLMRDGEAPERIITQWRDPSTPTKAATADQITKYVAAGVLYPDSDVTRQLMGLEPTVRERLAEEDRRRRSSSLLETLNAAPDARPGLVNLPDADDSPDSAT